MDNIFQKIENAKYRMSRVSTALSSGLPTRYDTNRAVQSQKMARDLKFQNEEVEGLY